jgi:hypothetical protein
MEIRKEIAGVLKYFSDEAITTDEAIDSILLLFGVSPRIILIQQLVEDPDDKTGWSPWGWDSHKYLRLNDPSYQLFYLGHTILFLSSYHHYTKVPIRFHGELFAFSS